MQNILNQIIQFVQQGIAGIFKFVGLIWGWVLGEVGRMTSLPWATLPWWKLLIAALGAAVAGFLLYKAGRSIWGALESTLKAFAGLLSALIVVLPQAIGAGAVIYGTLLIIRSL